MEYPCEKITCLHVINVVAFNSVDNYFIICNSWSPRWAKGGFVKVRCDQLYNFFRPTGRMSYTVNSQNVFPVGKLSFIFSMSYYLSLFYLYIYNFSFFSDNIKKINHNLKYVGIHDSYS